MDDLDSVLRGAAIGLSLLLGAAAWRARPGSGFAWCAALYAAGVAAYLLLGHPGFLAWPPLIRLLVGVLALGTPFFFWAQVRLVFDDGFRFRPLHWLWLALIEVCGVTGFALRDEAAPLIAGALNLGFRLIYLALIAQALWVIGRGHAGDLVEARARLRLAMLMLAGTGSALLILAAVIYGPVTGWSTGVRLGGAAGILLLNLAFAVVLLRVEEDFLPSPRSAAAIARPAAMVSAPGNADPDVDALARLEALMAGEEAWRETGLTIGGLAERIGIPEYRLRRLINQRLGFRNFTAFVNEYRLAAAASRLADQQQARVPVLTIALDLGWGSIGPFNRAFRARFGMPPSDYRRQRLQGAA